MNALNSTNDINSKSLPPTICFTAIGLIDIASPKKSYVDWKMIAQALSRKPRFNGLTGGCRSYTVAQHCVLGADALMKKHDDKYLAAQFLLHDAHEAFIGDITRPLEKCFGTYFSEQVKILKTKWDEVIYSVANLTPPALLDRDRQKLIEDMDNCMLARESRSFFPDQIERFPEMISMVQSEPMGVLKPWGSAAEILFLDRLKKYIDIVVESDA